MQRWLRQAGDDTHAVTNSQRLSSVLFDEEDHSNARTADVADWWTNASNITSEAFE